MWTAKDILDIPPHSPELLFPNDANEAKKLWHDLCREWHPDTNKESIASAVTAHITLLYRSAVDKIDAGTYGMGIVATFALANGKKAQFVYRKELPFECGKAFYGQRMIAYVFDQGFKDLAAKFETNLGSFKFHDAKMEEECKKYLPRLKTVLKTVDGGQIVVLEKTDDVYSLKDVLSYYAGRVEPKHVAWMLSRLHGILCYFQLTNICHNALTVDNLFVSPKYHTIMVYGGWGFSCKKGEKIVALPRQTRQICPASTMSSKIADPLLDRLSIRRIGLELLGDKTGMSFHKDKTVPKAMIKYLRSPTSGDAVKDYEKWTGKVLPDSFGVRKFIPMDIGDKEIFG